MDDVLLGVLYALFIVVIFFSFVYSYVKRQHFPWWPVCCALLVGHVLFL